jgi:uncharacterized protein (DUF2062 family)
MVSVALMPPFQPHASHLPALLQSLLARARRLLSWLWAQEGSHGQRARGLAAGIFCGCFPFFGLQTLLGVALASLVRGNHLLAAAGTWISNPFTYVPLYWFNYRLGCWLIGPAETWPGMAALRAGSLRQLGWSVASRLLLGSALVGLVASAVGGGLYWLWLEREQRRRDA